MSIVSMKASGLREFHSAIEKVQGSSDEALDQVVNRAAEMVVDRARRGVPTASGKARGSIRSQEGRVLSGGPRAPYFPWLDFGGRVGRGKSVARAWRPEGRYLFPAAKAERAVILRQLETSLLDVARSAGLEVH